MAGTLTHEHRADTARGASAAATPARPPLLRRAPAPPAPGRELASRLGARKPFVQPKLRVSDRHDPAEIEADRAAEQALGDGSTAPAKEGCSCGGTCDECQEDGEPVPSRAPAPVPEPSPVTDGMNGRNAAAEVDDVVRSPGEPLPHATRAFFERRFGADLRGVRVHTDTAAARSTAGLAARAYTVGEHVAFGTGEYRPGAPEGRHLLAHELAHVLQQRAGTEAIQRAAKTPPAVGRVDVAIVLDGAEESMLAAGALAGRVLRVYDEKDLRTKLQKLGVAIGTLYVISHSNAAGEVQFEAKIGTIDWVKIGDLAAVVKGALPGGKAPSLVDFRGCKLGRASEELGKFRQAAEVRSARATNCSTFESAVGPVHVNGEPVLKESDVTNKALFEKGLRKLITWLTADNGVSVRNCIVGLAGGETADRNFAKVRALYFRNRGKLVAQWVSPRFDKSWQAGSKCYKDLTTSTTPCRLVTASNEPESDEDEAAAALAASETATPVAVVAGSEEAAEEPAVA